mgnify:CR=1 FL=1
MNSKADSTHVKGTATSLPIPDDYSGYIPDMGNRPMTPTDWARYAERMRDADRATNTAA